MSRKTLERPFELKSVNDNGTFTGYGSVFGEIDSYRDIVMPGAFARSLQTFSDKKRKVPMLWQHDPRQPIGVYTTIKEDEQGLFVEGQINMKVQRGVEAHALMEQGALSGLSIGYDTVREAMDDKGMVRKLFEVDLWEVSPVTFPAGDSARIVSVKSIEGLTTLSECEQLLRDAGQFSRKEALAIIARIKAIGGTQSDSAEIDVSSINRVKDIIRSL